MMSVMMPLVIELFAHTHPLGVLIAAALAAGLAGIVTSAVVGVLVAAAVEAVALTWLVMTIVRRDPGHWLWRPLAWCVGLLAGTVGSLVLNLRLFDATALEPDHGFLQTLLAMFIPLLVSLPFMLLLVVLAIISIVRAVRRARRRYSAAGSAAEHGEQASGTTESGAALAANAKRGAHTLGRALLGRGFVLLGQVLLTAAMLMLALVILTMAGGLEVDEPFVSALILLVPTVVLGAPAVALLWAGRPAGSFRAIEQSP